VTFQGLLQAKYLYWRHLLAYGFRASQPQARPSRVGCLGFWLAVHILPSRDKQEHQNG
jgi:hypothetical protein